MATKGEVIAIEGVCCAGKTTLIKGLAAKLKSAVVPELPEFGRNLFQPFTDSEAILHNGHTSIPVERVRMIAATALSEIAGYAVLDRSFLSTLALGYGAIDLIGTRGYRGLANKVLMSINNMELPTPDKTLYISVNGPTVQKRNETRVPQLDDYWIKPERIERQNEFYKNLAKVVVGVELVNGAQEHEAVLADCIERSINAPTASGMDIAWAVEEFSNNV